MSDKVDARSEALEAPVGSTDLSKAASSEQTQRHTAGITRIFHPIYWLTLERLSSAMSHISTERKPSEPIFAGQIMLTRHRRLP